ncbi:MAG TPA: membrane protein insertase YidC, partial [Rhodospirillaceae bacterium]|nr:membrane protein insertase YidC [Rhodospirillaceae bacterium]
MDNNNFITAVILSIAILVGFHYFYEKPQLEKAQHQLMLQKEAAKAKPESAPLAALPTKERSVVLAETPRVAIATGELRGSINLKGGRIDDLDLVNYRETVAKDSHQITLFSPAGSAAPYQAYYATFGWLADAGVTVPDDQTIWKADRKTLEVGKPVLLSWDNGKGLLFEKLIAIDEHFLFTITDRVRNSSADTVTLYPYGLVARHGQPKIEDSYVLHEGPMGVLGGTLQEVKYSQLMEEPKIVTESQGGWLGITDKYWLVSLLPAQDEKITASFSYAPSTDASKPEQGTFQTDFRGTAVSLAAGASSERKTHLFAGAKRVSLLDQYEKQLNLPLFDRAIDFGWYYYLTKPFLYLLDGLNGMFGNMG